ncbi:hypothetical protein PFLUV_G00238430 [Perca fluviatilis]|uniref:SUN domain-containing protein n=1 Tax=Perca fluviatilis TaxID=8168 RepID=A0A6A5DW02_PERFL|nr:hypothetical protein PFLUV_G00238430 [Perca fluviatilis]
MGCTVPVLLSVIWVGLTAGVPDGPDVQVIDVLSLQDSKQSVAALEKLSAGLSALSDVYVVSTFRLPAKLGGVLLGVYSKQDNRKYLEVAVMGKINKESTMVADQSTVLADCTLIGSDGRCPKHVAQTISRVYCKDCELLDRTHVSSSKYSEPETPTVYCRDRIRKSKTGVLASLWCCVLSLLSRHLKLQKRFYLTARSGLCGVMNVREALAGQKELHPNGSLSTPALSTPTGDACQEKRRSEPDIVSSSSSASLPSSGTSCLLWLMWSAAVFTASRLSRLLHVAASAVWRLTQKVFSASGSAGRSAGKKAGDVFRRLNRRWHHKTTGLTRFPLRLLLVLLPLLLLFSSCVRLLFNRLVDLINLDRSEAALQSSSSGSRRGTNARVLVKTRVNMSAVKKVHRDITRINRCTGRQGGRRAGLKPWWRCRPLGRRWAERGAGGGAGRPGGASMRALSPPEYKRSHQSEQPVSCHQSISDASSQQQLEHLQRRLDEERQQTEQSRQQDALQQQSQTARLDQLELQLQKLAARTEEMQQRQEAATTVSPLPTTFPAAISGGVERQSHDALLAEVARLKAALEKVRRDVGGLSGCRDGCRGLDTIHHTISEQVSAQVREEVRVLVYGNQLTAAGGTSRDDAGGLQESLLQWLSRRCVSEADLQVALSSLERSVLQNISLQLKKNRAEGTGGQPVLHAAAGDAVTREDVQVMVKNALRLFSQDRTGMADYALESGGGSVLSTRCSETFETKAALLSLFGLPLWYFSQSPRAVIQPDVHPGNCWAFRGSTGFLVIRLSMKILPTAFSLEHIPKILAPSGALHSAPRDFSVYGLDDDSQEKGKLLGSFTYEEDGEALQTYAVTEENDRAFQIIEVQVLSNWGHQEYTCMYRFRVHGTPRDT